MDSAYDPGGADPGPTPAEETRAPVDTGPFPLDDPGALYRPYAEHGTVSGYRSHLDRQERPCVSCTGAQRTAQRNRVRSAPAPRIPVEGAPCGTMRGYLAHLGRREEPCAPCRDYRNSIVGRTSSRPAPAPLSVGGEQPSRRARRMARRLRRIFGANISGPCGTPGGFTDHVRRSAQPCAECWKVARRTQRRAALLRLRRFLRRE